MMDVEVNKITEGHVLDVLGELPDAAVNCIITSPPYWGLRAYKTQPVDWNGWKGELGLEPTPELYIEHLMMVFDECKRVLRKDGICFVNLGDTYGTHTQKRSGQPALGININSPANIQFTKKRPNIGLEKSLCAIPERFVLAMMERGWIRRCTIIWAKGLSFCETYSGSCMPDSAKDRPNHNGHEYIYMFVKAKEKSTDIEKWLPRKLKPEEAAWLAAMIDGEGCIGIAKHNKNHCNYGAYLRVFNNNLAIIERCKFLTGVGSISQRQQGDYRPGYVWNCGAKNAVSVIAETYPYLIAKREQAKVAIELQKLNKAGRKREGNRDGVGKRKLTGSEIKQRDDLWKLCKNLNQKETNDSNLPEPNLNRLAGCEKYWYEQQYEEAEPESVQRYKHSFKESCSCGTDKGMGKWGGDDWKQNPLGRTIRNVWTINPQAFSEAHFATFPEKLVEPLIRMGVPEYCCPKCGMGVK